MVRRVHSDDNVSPSVLSWSTPGYCQAAMYVQGLHPAPQPQYRHELLLESLDVLREAESRRRWCFGRVGRRGASHKDCVVRRQSNVDSRSCRSVPYSMSHNIGVLFQRSTTSCGAGKGKDNRLKAIEYKGF